ncbi:MAG: hypothetical protein K1X35_14850 [Caulobacteraceae bacterium]|nr:hypothetical protein [Caulobacteraceae bacterium]
MAQQADPRQTPPDPAARDLAERGADPASPEGADTEIAADDAGASAMAERARNRSQGLENEG